MLQSEYEVEDAPAFTQVGNELGVSHLPDRFFGSREWIQKTRESTDPNLVEINSDIIRIQAREGRALYRVTDVFPTGYGYTLFDMPLVVGAAPNPPSVD